MIFLQAAGNANSILQSLMLIGIVAVFYFMILRPQQKKSKEQKKFNEGVQKGDLVATTSGFIGKINKIEDGIVTLQLDQKTFVKITVEAISKELTDSIKDKNITIN